jgi:hypothetical protein
MKLGAQVGFQGHGFIVEYGGAFWFYVARSPKGTPSSSGATAGGQNRGVHQG